jgi:hypothetical protein
MSHIENFIRDIRFFMYGGMNSLPLTIGGTMLILGLFTANYAMLFFLLGFLIITPITLWLYNILLDKTVKSLLILIIRLISFGQLDTEYITSILKNTLKPDICKINIPYKTELNSPESEPESSTWVAMITFFIGYILKNAIELYSRKSSDVYIKSKVNNRKFQAIVSICSIIIFAMIVLGYRLYSGCESKVEIIVTSLIFIPLGFGWYKALSSVGQDRLSDIFGIANRLLSPTADEPVACIPSK